jgi:uncharacterized membrane protein YsdA (DUF1294 family)/cold shock CspA family protein
MRRRLPAIPKPEWTAKVVEWNTEKGYGWLQWADKRVFMHRRDYSGPNRTPEVGEEVHFILGKDAQGRHCAKNAVSDRGRGGGTGSLSLVLLCAMLGLPTVALQRLPIDLWKTAAYALTISLITYAAYASDKRRARTRAWRIPEAHLHLLELLGGWPGAFLAQRHLRHKCSKSSYQFIFVLIILIHQFAAYDSLQNLRLSRALIKNVAGTSISAHINDFSWGLPETQKHPQMQKNRGLGW